VEKSRVFYSFHAEKHNKGPWLSPRPFVVVGRKERIGVEK